MRGGSTVSGARNEKFSLCGRCADTPLQKGRKKLNFEMGVSHPLQVSRPRMGLSGALMQQHMIIKLITMKVSENNQARCHSSNAAQAVAMVITESQCTAAHTRTTCVAPNPNAPTPAPPIATIHCRLQLWVFARRLDVRQLNEVSHAEDIRRDASLQARRCRFPDGAPCIGTHSRHGSPCYGAVL